jgi:tripartite-type tricarboxylate transporter receptor subunit TctC
MATRRAVTVVGRREWLAALAAAGAAVTGCVRAPDVAAGPCPSLAGGRLRWVVPNAPGGGYDTESRLLKPLLEAALGVAIRIDNVPGAGGLIGARVIAGAPADGRTLGIIGVPGLLVASLLGQAEAPDPARAITVLGRISRSWHVWATGRHSGLQAMTDLAALSRRRAIVCGINEVGSANFVSVAGTAALLGLRVEFVSGFAGNRSVSLAAMRGDVDVVCFNYETIRDLIAAGDLRPLLQVSSAPIAADAGLAGVPLLGGPTGWAAQQASARGGDLEQARHRADGLARLMGAGRIVVAPANLPGAVAACLREAAASVLTGEALHRATRRQLDPAPADAAYADVVSAADVARPLVPVIDDALARIRGRG